MRERDHHQYDLEVIAGPCSVSLEHLSELYEMSEIQVTGSQGEAQRALSAVRFVGLKSRTEYNPTGEGTGIDFKVLEQAIIYGPTKEVPPSILLAEQFVKETGVGVAAEIMLPGIQLPYYEKRIPKAFR